MSPSWNPGFSAHIPDPALHSASASSDTRWFLAHTSTPGHLGSPRWPLSETHIILMTATILGVLPVGWAHALLFSLHINLER